MKISIITINFNNLEGLKKTVNSVVSQTYNNIEYIIIDGASTDGSAEYIKEQKQYFNYWVSEPDKGIYNAMNKGIDHATGDYLLFLNSGDIIYNNDVLDNLFSNNEEIYSVIYGDTLIHGDDDQYINRKFPERLFFSFFLETSIGHQSSFIHNSVFEVFKGYDESYKIVSDWKLFILVFLEVGMTFKKINSFLSIVEANGISSNDTNNSQRIEERKHVINDLTKNNILLEDIYNLYVYKREFNLFKLKRLVRVSLFFEPFIKRLIFKK